MKIKISVVSVLFLILLFLAGGSGCIAATEGAPDEEGFCLIPEQEVPRMTIDELKSHLSDPSLILIDVRASGDWNASSTKIKGALREVLNKVEEWAPKYDKNKTIVLYCA